MQSALFVGRFQPFHKGHLSVVEKILNENERVIIAIGSAENNFLRENPLTAGERFQLIEESLKEAGIPAEKYCIIPIRNLNNFALWVNHVNTYVPPYTKIYTGSEIVKACYEGKYRHTQETVKNAPKIVNLKRKLKISASTIRTMIINGENAWKDLVPPAVVRKFEEWKIPKRLQIIKNTMDPSKIDG